MLKRISITWWILIGLLAGIALGYMVRLNGSAETVKSFSDNISILSDIFLRLIKMIIAPLVFSTLVVGIAKIGDFKTVGRIGIKTLVYFYAATIVALVLGLLLVNIFKPGESLHFQEATNTLKAIEVAKPPSAREFITHIIPKSIFEAMANNEILSIVVFAIFFGIGTAAIGEKGRIVVSTLDAVAHIMFKITNYVMKFAPFGVFGAIAAVIAKQGIGILWSYANLIILFYSGLIFFGFVILGAFCYAIKIPFLKLFRHVRDPFILAYSTASSEAAFPKMVESLEKFGCSNRIISFVLPLGYSFNLDGSIMYMTFATAFIAQAYGRVLSIEEQITMMLILLVTSKGVAGVPRASLVVIAALLPQFNLPEAGLLLLLGIDQILDMGRSAINIIGNAVATAVVSKWENELEIPVDE